MTKLTRKHVKKHVDKSLQRRFRIYFMISIILLCLIIYDVITGLVSIPLAFSGVILGTLLGVITARMFHISWDKDAKKVISRLDVLGVAILILYIIFAIFRSKLIEYFVHGPAVGGVSIAIITGIMIGRVIGTRGKIVKVLRENKIF